MIKSGCCGAAVVNAPDGDGAMCSECCHPVGVQESPQRGSVETLAQELYELGTSHMGLTPDWDEINDTYHDVTGAWKAIAEHVLKHYERKDGQ